MSCAYTVFLTLGLLTSGVCIPLILTFQDKQSVAEDVLFTQPLIQTVMIFLGEIICILIIHLVTKAPSLLDRSLLEAVQPSYDNADWEVPRTSSLSWSAAWFILPSACDLIATTLLNLGLIYTSPSVYQMVKSSIVGFSALFSVLFLSRRFIGREWISILAILVGAGMIVGSVHGNYLGPVYLLVAQFFVAGQFILEEYFMDHYHLDPVRAMGIEGMFSTLLLGGALVIAALFGRDEFDIKSGVQQVLGNSDLWQSALLLSFMVAIFNFFGLAVSTAVGVLGRSTLDALRTILTWVIAIKYGWDSFNWLELSGFVILLLGVLIFNGIFSSIKSCLRGRQGESAPLLS